MRRYGGRLMLAIAALACGARGASAQGSTCTVTAPATSCSVDFTFSMPTVRVVVLELSTTAFAFPPLGAAELNAGYADASGPGALVKSNLAWQLQVSSGSQSTWQSAGGSQDKPSSDLQWAAAEGGPFADLLQSDAVAASGAAGGDHWIPLYFRTKLAWTKDAPGDYALTITYTLIAP